MPRTKNKTQTKETIIACYCHYTGFSACVIEKITAVADYEIWEQTEKRWTVAKVINGVPSFEQIEKQLLELKQANNYISSIPINKGFIFLNNIVNYRLKFREVELENILENSGSFNADVFNLIALVNDKKLVFTRQCSELMEQIKYYNVNVHSNDLNCLILAIKSIPLYKINNMLYLEEYEENAEKRMSIEYQ